MTQAFAGAPRAGVLQDEFFRTGAGIRPKLAVRGPVLPDRSGAGRHIAVLGGTLTFGQGVARPYPQLLEEALGVPVMNLGCRNAGIDAALRDPVVLALAARAGRVVVQITGAQALSNPFYRVHPRRNDRLIGPTEALRQLYPEVDFTPFAFTGHLLGALAARDSGAGEGRFARVVQGLRATWVARMRALSRAVAPPAGAAGGNAGRVTLLWVGAPPVPEGVAPGWPAPDPAFVTGAMLDALRPGAGRLVMMRPGHAAALPGAQTALHRRLAEGLAAALR